MLSDVSHISNISLSGANETTCSSVLSSRVDLPPNDLNNLDISSLQAPENLLDGCRVCLTVHVKLLKCIQGYKLEFGTLCVMSV